MSAAEIVRAFMAAVDAGDLDKAASYLSPDFVFSGPVPEPIGKDQFVGMQRLLSVAFPDWSFNLIDVQENGSTATTTHQITGTHLGELDLSMMGMPSIPATGRTIKLPQENARCTVKDGKLLKLETGSSPDAGMPGILAQLGVAMPPAA